MTFCEAVEQPRLRYPNLSHRIWTDEQLKDLRNLHDEGLSATLIARWMTERYGEGGPTFSRNAIIGACHRYGFPKRPSKVLTRASRPSARFARIPAPRPKPLPPPIMPASFLGVTFMQLELNQCRFPRGDEPILFCGQPQREGSSYCPHCHSIAHRGLV